MTFFPLHVQEYTHSDSSTSLSTTSAYSSGLVPVSPIKVGEFREIWPLPDDLSLATTIVTSTTDVNRETFDIDLVMPKISKCESGDIDSATNPRSSAKGRYQILDGTWAGFQCTGSPFNAEDSKRCAYKIATTSGLQHWDESKYCWGK